MILISISVWINYQKRCQLLFLRYFYCKSHFLNKSFWISMQNFTLRLNSLRFLSSNLFCFPPKYNLKYCFQIYNFCFQTYFQAFQKRLFLFCQKQTYLSIFLHTYQLFYLTKTLPCTKSNFPPQKWIYFCFNRLTSSFFKRHSIQLLNILRFPNFLVLNDQT